MHFWRNASNVSENVEMLKTENIHLCNEVNDDIDEPDLNHRGTVELSPPAEEQMQQAAVAPPQLTSTAKEAHSHDASLPDSSGAHKKCL